MDLNSLYILLPPPQCKQIHFPSLMTTLLLPLNLASLLLGYGFIAVLLIKSVPNLPDLGVQFEDSFKGLLAESSNLSNHPLRLLVGAPLSQALCHLLFKAWELRKLCIVTHLQILKLLAEVPHLHDAEHTARLPDSKCRSYSCPDRTPCFQSQLWDLCVTASSLRTKWYHAYHGFWYYIKM